MKVGSVMKWTAMGLFVLICLAVQHRRDARISIWPSISGEVEQVGRDNRMSGFSISLGSHSSNHSRRHHHPVVLEYRYQVQEVTYHGIYRHDYASSTQAERAIKAHPAGSRVIVKYDPAAPDDSVLAETP